MAKAKETEVNKNLTYDDQVIKKIVGLATAEVDGIQPLNSSFMENVTDKITGADENTVGIDAEVGQKQVALDLNVVCRYGVDVAKAFDEVVKKATEAVKKMTGLDVIELNMHVENILSEDEFNDRYKKAKE